MSAGTNDAQSFEPTVACPVCSTGKLKPFLKLPAVPVLSTAFHRDLGDALGAPRGDLDLALCRACSLVWNTAFEPELVDYTPDYENSQHFSPAFQDYVASLARRLDDLHGLAGRIVVDVGCGKGEFLALLAEVAHAHGLGFDPTFDGDVDSNRIEVIREYYDIDTAAEIDAALVMARHVVEHLADPVGFLANVREASGPAAAMYYEVPNAEFVFSDDGMWDLIYQHVGYFSVPSLDMALRASGHRVIDVTETFHGQFLGIDAVPAEDPKESEPVTLPPAEETERVVSRVETFARRHRERLDGWNELLSDPDVGDCALWGAGAKGVAFLNLLDDPSAIDHVIDVNPRKAGRYVPGTGQRVDRPDVLAGRPVRLVLIMNPAYESEIRDELSRLGVDATVKAV